MTNGPLIERLLSRSRGETLDIVSAASHASPAKAVTMLYLATLSREPCIDELSRMRAYLERGIAEHLSRDALADIPWTLLNCSEFMSNH